MKKLKHLLTEVLRESGVLSSTSTEKGTGKFIAIEWSVVTKKKWHKKNAMMHQARKEYHPTEYGVFKFKSTPIKGDKYLNTWIGRLSG